ncbi:hypothetical protein TetV_134 [Tetraselmis virus 1]|uniref:Uncharacterized protein n=1 Tax=Tetraselmis virus 1 TaxID=2060617 RepID=A0A2P0VMV5_9VIRU|nr:hypothetical protein QJ968_gp134 [Tetraselmis virus 1]AUF82226.1 hypothetical protein TetV_134 [Tetraselmis virus 1]
MTSTKNTILCYFILWCGACSVSGTKMDRNITDNETVILFTEFRSQFREDLSLQTKIVFSDEGEVVIQHSISSNNYLTMEEAVEKVRKALEETVSSLRSKDSDPVQIMTKDGPVSIEDVQEDSSYAISSAASEFSVKEPDSEEISDVTTILDDDDISSIKEDTNKDVIDVMQEVNTVIDDRLDTTKQLIFNIFDQFGF